MKKEDRRLWFHSIRGQLIGVSVGVNFLIGVIALLFMHNYSQYMDMHLEYLEHINNINSLYSYQQKNSELLIEAMEQTSEDKKEEFSYNMNIIYSLLETIDSEETSNSVKVRLRVLPYLEKSFANQALSLMTRGEDVDNSNRYLRYLEAIEYHMKINNYIQEILSMSMEENSEFLESTESTVSSMKSLFIVIIIGICVFNIVFFTIYNAYLTKPIDLLAKKVKNIGKGNWDIDMADVGGPDDIQALADKIGKMTDNIKSLSQDVQDKAKLEVKLMEDELERVRMQELLKESQLQGIQMQINPHFLFNTLNVISRMSLIEDAEKTYDLIMSLSKFMRHSLKPIKNQLPLSEEVDMITQYLHILKARMGENLTIRVDADSEALSQPVPVFSLQPIVENAFRHGIEDMTEGCEIAVDVKKRNHAICIRVYDNGKGMDREMLAAVREKTKITSVDFSKDVHIGIENVCYRLNMILGNAVRYIISSKPMQGTIFTIIIEQTEDEE